MLSDFNRFALKMSVSAGNSFNKINLLQLRNVFATQLSVFHGVRSVSPQAHNGGLEPRSNQPAIATDVHGSNCVVEHLKGLDLINDATFLF